jgi:hypothetical protein
LDYPLTSLLTYYGNPFWYEVGHFFPALWVNYSPALTTTWQLVQCCTVICPSYLQRGNSSNVMPTYAQLVGNIDTFPGIEKAHGRFALPRAAPYSHTFVIIIISQTLCANLCKKVKGFMFF